jgi:hypothetical protein
MELRSVGMGSGGAYLEERGSAVSDEPEPSVERAAEVMVEADVEQRRTQREAARAAADVAHAARQQAIAELRAAADDTWSAAITQACIGGAAAVAQGVSAGAAGVAQGAAGAASAATSAVEAGGAAGQAPLWSTLVGIGGRALNDLEPALDPFDGMAEAHRIGSQERGDGAQVAGDEAQRLWSDAEASRAARGSHLEAAGRAVDLLEQGRLIAIGRESG